MSSQKHKINSFLSFLLPLVYLRAHTLRLFPLSNLSNFFHLFFHANQCVYWLIGSDASRPNRLYAFTLFTCSCLEKHEKMQNAQITFFSISFFCPLTTTHTLCFIETHYHSYNSCGLSVSLFIIGKIDSNPETALVKLFSDLFSFADYLLLSLPQLPPPEMAII